MNSDKQIAHNVSYDIGLLFPVLFLVGIGIVMVYSASSAVALKKFGTDNLFLKKQALFALLGIVGLVICRHFPYRWYRPLTYPLLVLALVFLIAIEFTDLGLAAGGSVRWLRFGRLSFQPSEFARFALVIFLAYSLEKKGEKLKEFSIGFIPHVVVLGVFSFFIIKQPDFGSVVILAALTWLMLFVGGVRCRHLFGSLLLLMPMAYFFLASAEYRMKRILSFLNPWQYSADEGYQIVHSLMAFGTGGLWGVGIGKGYQKLFYLPEPHTDFIFSIIGEEFGLVGVLIIIMLYALILFKGIQIARHASDTFGSMMAVGLTAAMGLQICINMGVALGLLPTKGLTLPFLSYGGTSLLLNMASVGILMNISASRRAPAPGQ
ncbi:MAG: putative lipid II flippase FtsW [Desulfobacterales bacterium]|nr:MAG: putative lipid II flippase FtsW [Desulfobacterales bacterium]